MKVGFILAFVEKESKMVISVSCSWHCKAVHINDKTVEAAPDRGIQSQSI